jgi:hypothetical protein
MRATRFANRLSRRVFLLTFAGCAAVQTAGADSSGASPAPSSWGGSVGIVAVVVLMVLAVGVAVKLVDRKRKREEEVVLLQSGVSDALLLDRSLAGRAITAVASGSLWGRSPVVLTITGTVPTAERREAVMRLVAQEVSRRHAFARIEDRLVVDPLVHKQPA